MKKFLVLRIEVKCPDDDFSGLVDCTDDLLDGGEIQELIENHARNVRGVEVEIEDTRLETEVKP